MRYGWAGVHANLPILVAPTARHPRAKIGTMKASSRARCALALATCTSLKLSADLKKIWKDSNRRFFAATDERASLCAGSGSQLVLPLFAGPIQWAHSHAHVYAALLLRFSAGPGPLSLYPYERGLARRRSRIG